MKQTIGDFLFRRLAEAGVGHAFGVPGDYNLVLMRQLIRAEPAPRWIGTCNELNGAYAADGYARLNGIGALLLTNGVGALSAINGVAGSYSEHVPVVAVCGTLPLNYTRKGLLMHHSLADRSQGPAGQFYRAFAEVTEAQSRLDHDNAASEIDRLILTAWRRKRPVYLEIPSDLPYLEIEAPDGPLRLDRAPSDQERLASCAEAIAGRLRTARRPALLLDSDTQRFALEAEVAALAERWGLRTAVLGNAKSAFDETSPLFAGVYAGRGSSPATREAIEGGDCLITLGYRRIESTTGFFTDDLPADTIHVNATWTDIGEADYQGVNVAELLAVLLEVEAPTRERLTTAGTGAEPATADAVGVADADLDAPLTQAAYWQAMQEFVSPGDVLVVEDGTSLAGAGGLDLPPDATLVSQALVWGSIGYTTGALLGTLLAAPERRHLLFTGDGSFQLTAQEISTILREDLKPFVFLINNHGYTIERTILGKDDFYNDVANWSYAELPRVFKPGTDAETYVVRTARELRAVLDAPHAGLVFVEALLDKDDSPVALIESGHGLAEADYGPRGPQHEPDAQIPLPAASDGA